MHTDERGLLRGGVAVDKGEVYRIGAVSVRSVTPEGEAAVAAAAAGLDLRVGDPARAEPVLAAERRLLDRLLASGHPLAVVAGRDAVVYHDRRTMEVAWRIAPLRHFLAVKNAWSKW